MVSAGIMSTRSRTLISIRVKLPTTVNQATGMTSNLSMGLFLIHSLVLHSNFTTITTVMMLVNKSVFAGPKYTNLTLR